MWWIRSTKKNSFLGQNKLSNGTPPVWGNVPLLWNRGSWIGDRPTRASMILTAPPLTLVYHCMVGLVTWRPMTKCVIWKIGYPKIIQDPMMNNPFPYFSQYFFSCSFSMCPILRTNSKSAKQEQSGWYFPDISTDPLKVGSKMSWDVLYIHIYIYVMYYG